MMPWHGPRGKAASAIPPMDIRVIRIGQGGKGSGCSIFGHSPIHLREYQTAEGLTSGKQERGRTWKSLRADGNSA